NSERSSPAEKWSPSPTSKTALASSGSALKKDSSPRTVVSSSALRFCGRLSRRMATSPLISAARDFGRLMCTPLLRGLSLDFINIQLDRERKPGPAGDRKDAVDPGKRPIARLEPHRGAEVI